MVDHFEPGTNYVQGAVEQARVQELLEEYPRLVKHHQDGDGRVPRRTWFFPPHYHRFDNLKKLVSLCEQGYGEIELHLHHGRSRPDTAENLRRTLEQCIEEYGLFGIFGKQEGKRRYGFVHGDWALDNSQRGRFCGVNNEIQILSETGCYADFTFPSRNESNPLKINSIFYATDDPLAPKSHNKGSDVIRNGHKTGDLMIIQGPIHPYFLDRKLWKFRALGDSINRWYHTETRRIDLWVATGIALRGKSDFIFIKTHTHGAVDNRVVLGKEMEDVFGYLESHYNDGSEYILHYVTARELYNVIKAVEANEPLKDPVAYADYAVKPPKYTSSQNCSEASDVLKKLVFYSY
jgi:hypothetical protein